MTKGKAQVVVMSSKGQVVVPRSIRETVDAEAGTEFVVYGKGDTIVLKKILAPAFSQKELEKLVEESQRKLRQAGFATEKEVLKLVEEAVTEARRSG